MTSLVRRLHWKWEGLASFVIERRARRAVARRWRSRATAQSADGAPIIVSLTSYPPRFATLALTIKSLLTQTLRPEAVVLWIGENDMAALPADVLALRDHGLEIRACEDLRSFTKFIHAIREFPAHRIAICDDDTWYRPRWLEQLAVDLPADRIACHRIHRIRVDARGEPLSYHRWEQQSPATDASPLNFPTGVGGVLFRAEQLDPRVADAVTARALCPSADDIWLYWMGRLGGSLFVRVGDNDRLVTWRDSQHVALWQSNNGMSANDVQMQAMTARFGAAHVEIKSAEMPAMAR